MKKIIFLSGFLLAIAGALVTQANSIKFATRFQQADPTNKAATCIPIPCSDFYHTFCTYVYPGYATYKSILTQPDCNTPTLLFKAP
jgi:hypothetical protein